MLTFVIPISVYQLCGLLLVAVLTGYLFRRRKLKKLGKKIDELEKEVLSYHYDVLEYQKEKSVLEQKLKESSNIPVIPITSVSTDEAKPDKLQDMAIRKKLLGQQSAEK